MDLGLIVAPRRAAATLTAMHYDQPLCWAVLRTRYKRFLADVELEGPRLVVAHVPNSGAMRACSTPGSPCLVSPAIGPRRKLLWTLEQVIDHGVAVGVNTGRANALAEEALASGVIAIPGLKPRWEVRREVQVGRSRLDLRLDGGDSPIFVEVKSVSWAERGVALFPDAVTDRGRRHLGELVALRRRGQRAALVLVVQRGDASSVRPARQVDPAWAEALQAAVTSGVVVRAVQLAVHPAGLLPWRELPVLA